jgi:hypothetical protein
MPRGAFVRKDAPEEGKPELSCMCVAPHLCRHPEPTPDFAGREVGRSRGTELGGLPAEAVVPGSLTALPG